MNAHDGARMTDSRIVLRLGVSAVGGTLGLLTASTRSSMLRVLACARAIYAYGMLVIRVGRCSGVQDYCEPKPFQTWAPHDRCPWHGD